MSFSSLNATSLKFKYDYFSLVKVMNADGTVDP